MPDDGPLLWRARHRLRPIFAGVAFAVIGLGAITAGMGIFHASIQEIATGMLVIVGGAVILVWRRRA